LRAGLARVLLPAPIIPCLSRGVRSGTGIWLQEPAAADDILQ